MSAGNPVGFLDGIHDQVHKDGRVVKSATSMVVGLEPERLGEVDGAGRIGDRLAHGADEAPKPGCQDILVVAVDHLTGLSKAMATVCLRANGQTCIVHQIRHGLKYAARKDELALAAPGRPIDQTPTEAAKTAALAKVAADWGSGIRRWRVRGRPSGTNERSFIGSPRAGGEPSTRPTPHQDRRVPRPWRQVTASKSRNDGCCADENA